MNRGGSLDTILKERWQLAKERMEEIPEEQLVKEPYRDYFVRTVNFWKLLFQLWEIRQNEQWKQLVETEKANWNHRLYEDVLPEMYKNSYANPEFAQQILGKEYGKELSFLYSQIRSCIVFAFEGRLWDMTILAEFFLEIYTEFSQEELPKSANIREVIYSFLRDYCDDCMEYRVREMVDPTLTFAYDIIMYSDLNQTEYLYEFGEYISENERKMAQFLASLPQSDIDVMAKTYTEGYRIGFVNNGIDLTKKKTVNIRYCLGFERVVRAAILQFQTMGLQPILYRSASHLINKRQHLRIGYYGAIPNQQYDYDHRNDAALYLTEEMVQKKLRALQHAFEKYKTQANTHAGPAVMETFGEVPFVPESKSCVYELSEKQQKLQVRLNNESSQITNRYIIGKERSFTIIAWPIPEIGEQFEEIFKETVRLNTLDYKKYQTIQQCMIDALDRGKKVKVKGRNGNTTNLTIALAHLNDPQKETIFENCVADVNIPVGEVFTSPVLKGTHGTLNVSRVFLNDLEYQNLTLQFENGMITSYDCDNFDALEENQAYIRENVLYQHDTLPMGEFAVGTNTTAYVMAQKYQIAEKLPILIAEKMGPHFAVGDTCYSWSEDVAVYNPNGKEVIARDNEVSILRKTELSKAYYGCHTDITIPYEELEFIRIIEADGKEISLLEKGRFVLEGTETLNEPFSS